MFEPVGCRGHEQGRVYTQACPRPGQEIEVVVKQGEQTRRISSDQLMISKTGDGIPVEISTSID